MENAKSQAIEIEFVCLCLPDTKTDITCKFVVLWKQYHMALCKVHLMGLKSTCTGGWESKWNPSQSTWLRIALHIFKEEFGCHGFHKIPSHDWVLFNIYYITQNSHPVYPLSLESKSN